MAKSKSPFIEVLRDAQVYGIDPNKTAKARQFFRLTAEQTFTTPNQILGTVPIRQLKNNVDFGKMYMFQYDAKTKDKLPVWDRFPCIIVIGINNDGFTGLNLHYLPYKYRAAFMDALYEFVSDEKYNAKTTFTATYPLLKASYRTRFVSVCIKRYLLSHVRSRIVNIPPKDWDTAMFLPVEQFTDVNYLRNLQSGQIKTKFR